MLLELRQVSKSYRGMPVLRNLNFAVREGELVGVIGPNGAGKTTALGVVAGNIGCDSGTVLLDGRDVTSDGAHSRCRAGVCRTFQIPRPFQAMSVYENALVGASFGRGLRGVDASRAARDAIESCGLGAMANQAAGTLSLLQRKRLELARAMAAGPRLLLLDEVGGGLSDAEVHELLALIKAVHASGVTVVWVEHLVHALVSVVERLIVLAEGALLADGIPSDVISSSLVRQTYLGDELAVPGELPMAAENA